MKNKVTLFEKTARYIQYFFLRPFLFHFEGRLYMPRPEQMLFNVTKKCDGRCIMCSLWKETGSFDELDISELDKLFKAPLFKDLQSIMFSGGEPTLRKDIADIVNLIKENCTNLKDIGLATNGLDSETVIERIKDILEIIKDDYQLVVQVSLDGVGIVHDKIRGVKGAYDNVLLVLRKLTELQKSHKNLEFKLSYVAQPENISTIEDIFNSAKSMNLKLEWFPASIIYYFRNRNNSSRLKLSTVQKQKLKMLLQKEIRRNPPSEQNPVFILLLKEHLRMLEGKNRNRRCNFIAGRVILLEANGDITCCPNSNGLIYGNILNDQIGKGWYSREGKEKRDYIQKNFCPSCDASCGYGDLNLFESIKCQFLILFSKIAKTLRA